MTAHRRLELGTYLIGAALLVYTWLEIVPPIALVGPWNPERVAVIAAIGAVCAVVLVRAFLPDKPRIERLLLASILGVMPLIYVWAAILDGSARDIAIESGGLILFGGVAVVGFLRSTRLLAVAILAHGLCWDAWHHGHASYIEAWYPAACLLFDLALGIMVVVYAFAASREPPMRSG
jgi:hypothetical protein